MRAASRSSFEAQAPFRVVERGERAVRLSTGAVSLRLSVLAPDLFRIQAVARGRSPGQPSWAVHTTHWPTPKVRITRSARHVRLATDPGALEFDLRTGTLRLRDPGGAVRLQSCPDHCGCPVRKVSFGFHLSGDECFLGMGESSGPFNRAGLVREFWNTDVLGRGGINPGQRSLYTSIPFTVLVRDGRALGVFWDNPSRQQWDLGQADPALWKLSAASGQIDLHLFTGPQVSAVVQRYGELTGRMPLPPRWALGYHQCRYSYETRADLERIARQLRRRRIPCDALYLDIHHMNGFRVFTFGRSFPRPGEMMAGLQQRGFRTVAIVDPGVKVDRQFGVFRRGKRLKAYVRRPDGRRDYVGAVWPGRSVFPDFLNERVRRWWGREQRKLQQAGVEGFWNDMNEPANFAHPSKTLPETCRHETDHGPDRHALVHNLYAMQMARASREGALQHRPDRRPFVITRAAHAGTQRYAMLWTGDNASTWEHLADAVQMLLNLGLSGFAFCGSDAGGFLENCTPELYARWMQMAAFTPFFRNHTMTGTRPHEPWSFGPRTEAIVRSAIELRYHLLPYWYCLFAEAHRTGTPMMRPLVWLDQEDPVAAACGDQFLVGSSLLVAPVLRQGAVARSVYLPAGVWVDFWSGRRHHGRRHLVAEAPLHRLPLFVRGGAILPMTALRQHTSGPADATVNLHLWPGGSGELDWYEDDGWSQAYEHGDSLHRVIRLRRRRNAFELSFGPSSGRFAGTVKLWRVILHGARRPLRPSLRHGRTRFDPLTRIGSFECHNPAGAMTIRMDA